jgi:hypothetical protein
MTMRPRQQTRSVTRTFDTEGRGSGTLEAPDTGHLAYGADLKAEVATRSAIASKTCMQDFNPLEIHQSPKTNLGRPDSATPKIICD